MKKTSRFLTGLLLLAIALLPIQVVHADGLSDGQVVFGKDYTVESGDTLGGDLVVIDGSATVEKGATVTGAVVVIGGDADIAGSVGSDLVVVGGTASISASAIVGGNVTAVGGQVEQAEGARVDGEVITNIPMPEFQIPALPDMPNIPLPNGPAGPAIEVQVNPLWNLFAALATALVLSMLAMLATLFMQPQLERISQAIVTRPVVAGLLGVLTYMLFPVAFILLLFILPAVILMLAWFFGMVALGQEIGERFIRALRQEWAPVLTTGLGTFVLMFALGALDLLNALPFMICVTWIPKFLVSVLGVGAVMMTGFGARSIMPPRLFDPTAPAGEAELQLPPAS